MPKTATTRRVVISDQKTTLAERFTEYLKPEFADTYQNAVITPAVVCAAYESAHLKDLCHLYHLVDEDDIKRHVLTKNEYAATKIRDRTLTYGEALAYCRAEALDRQGGFAGNHSLDEGRKTRAHIRRETGVEFFLKFGNESQFNEGIGGPVFAGGGPYIEDDPDEMTEDQANRYWRNMERRRYPHMVGQSYELDLYLRAAKP